MNSPAKEEKRIDSLTSLRFFAAALIVVYHAQGHFACLDNIGDRIIFSQGITFFFVLSGFILTLVYPSFSSKAEVIEYLAKRFARLWPLHISVFLMRFVMFPKALLTFPGAAPKLLVMLSNIFMLQAWVPYFQFFFSYNAPSWTISTEWFFYFCLPFLLPLMARSKWLPAAITFGITCAFIALCNYLGLNEFDQQGLSLRGVLYVNPIPRLFEFVIGMSTAVIYRDVVSHFKWNRVVSTLSEIFALTVTLLLMFYTKPMAEAAGMLPWIGRAGTFWIEYSGAPLLGFSLLIMATARRNGLISWILAAPFLVLLGDISYAIYLCHHPLLVYHGLYLSQYRSWAAFGIFLAILFLISHLLFTAVEKPFRRLLVGAVKNVIHNKTKPSFSIPKLQLTGKAALVPCELLLLAGLLVISHSPPQKLTIAEANKFVNSSNQIGNAIKVGDSLSCMGVIMEKNDDAKLKLVWKALVPIELDQFVSVQLLDEKGEAKYQQLVRMSPRVVSVPKGETFLEEIELPGLQFENASTLGLSVIKANQQPMPLSGGETDSEGKRLLINLQPLLSDKAKTKQSVY